MSEARNGGKPYHHGDLRTALISAAEQELIEKGVDAFSLRGTAKRAGVSHAAPAHHFKDAMALLDALAAAGFARLTTAMKEEQAHAGGDALDQLVAAGAGYVRFAIDNPELLQLMFGMSRRKGDDPDLHRYADAAFSVLVNAIGNIRGRDAFRTEAGWRDAAACWSMVHGYAQLATAGRMEFVTGLAFDRQRGLLEEMLRRLFANASS